MSEVKYFNLPDVGEGLTEAEIVSWRVQPGDEVAVNQTIVDIETAKATVELPSPYDGVVGDLLAGEGQTVEVGTPIIAISTGEGTAVGSASEDGGHSGEPGEPSSPSEPAESGGSLLVGYGPRARSARRRPRKERGAGRAAEPGDESAPDGSPDRAAEPGDESAAGSLLPAAQSATERGRVSVLAKPPVRKLAKDLGVDLATVEPTGPGGTVTRDDVSTAARRTEAEPTAAPASGAPPAADASREQRIPVKGVRKHTAAAMVSSAFTAPHVTEFLTVDVSPTVEAVERIQRMPDLAEVAVSPLLLTAKALLLAIRRHPVVNSTWDEQAQEIVVKEYVNLGVAVATSRGLLVPNVKGAEAMPLPRLAHSLQTLIRTARDGKATPEDLQGGTITITNVGVFGVDAGTPILNPGEAAILALGAIRERPWVHEGQVVPRQVLQLSLSFDHRIVDGELGSKVLVDIGTMLADPAAMLAWS